MEATHKGRLINGDSEINVNHNVNTHEMSVNVDKSDVAQIYVVQIKQGLKKDLAAKKLILESLTEEALEFEKETNTAIEALCEKEFKGKVDKVNETYKQLKSDIKALVKKASSGVDKAIESLFEDHEDIDSRIKYSVSTPQIEYRWRWAKVYRDEESAASAITVTLKIDGHEERRDIELPMKIMGLKDKFLGVQKNIKSTEKEIRDLKEKLNSTKDLQEAAEAAVAKAKLEQSDFGKKCLENLQALTSEGLLLESK